jgi:uncharacterized protein YaaQ
LEAAPQKLVIVITDDGEADTLIDKLVGRGYPATKVSSTGGFLRKGSATILSGVEEGDVDVVLGIIRAETKARIEFVPAQATPFPDTALPREPIEVRVGGAIVFVLAVERFLKT